MKYFLSIIFAILCLNLSAQSKWSVGIVSGIDLSGIQFDKEFQFTDQNGQPLSDIYEKSLQIRYGINIGYALNDRLTLKSGLRINAQGDQSSIDASDLRWGIQHDGQGGFDPTLGSMEPLSFDRVTSKFRERFIEMPIHLSYTVSKGKWRWYVEGGVSPNYHLASISINRFDNDKPTRQSLQTVRAEYNRFTASVDLGFGIQRTIGERSSLFIQPMARYYVAPILSGGASLDHHFYNFGIEVGASYALGR